MLTGGEPRKALRVLLCLGLALAFASGVQRFADAQVLYGTLLGTVLDQTNAVVAGATVVVTNSGTGIISGGTFTGSAANAGTISGGIFNLAGNYLQTAGSMTQTVALSANDFTISGGSFTGGEDITLTGDLSLNIPGGTIRGSCTTREARPTSSGGWRSR